MENAPLYLVTGGSGYFGNFAARFLKERGTRVRIFDLRDFPGRPPDTEFVPGDIRQPDVLEQACTGVDCIFHFATQVPLAKDKKLFQSVNVQGTSNVLEAARRQKIRKVIFLSSSAVCGVPSKNPLNEKDLPRPLEPYGRSKYEAEKIAGRFIETGSDITILRPRTILNRGRLGIFSILFDWIAKGRAIPLLGDGRSRYQFLHAEDLAEACWLASRRRGPALYHVGAEKFGTWRELFEALIRHAGSSSKIKIMPDHEMVRRVLRLAGRTGLSPLADYHALMYGREFFFDVSKAKEELGWRPRYNNDDMICEAYDGLMQLKAHPENCPTRSRHQQAVREGILKLVRFLL